MRPTGSKSSAFALESVLNRDSCTSQSKIDSLMGRHRWDNWRGWRGREKESSELLIGPCFGPSKDEHVASRAESEMVVHDYDWSHEPVVPIRSYPSPFGNVERQEIPPWSVDQER